MINKYLAYKLIAPFKTRRQLRLNSSRSQVSYNDFKRDLASADASDKVTHGLWLRLRDLAFVDDFRPSVNDSLQNLFGLSPDSVRDELIGPLLESANLEINSDGINFASVKTPTDVVKLIQGRTLK